MRRMYAVVGGGEVHRYSEPRRAGIGPVGVDGGFLKARDGYLQSGPCSAAGCGVRRLQRHVAGRASGQRNLRGEGRGRVVGSCHRAGTGRHDCSGDEACAGQRHRSSRTGGRLHPTHRSQRRYGIGEGNLVRNGHRRRGGHVSRDRHAGARGHDQGRRIYCANAWCSSRCDTSAALQLPCSRASSHTSYV